MANNNINLDVENIIESFFEFIIDISGNNKKKYFSWNQYKLKLMIDIQKEVNELGTPEEINNYHNYVENVLFLPWVGSALNDNKLTNFDRLNLKDANEKLTMKIKQIIEKHFSTLR